MTGQYWEARHQEGDTPWNIGKASPPLVAYMSQVKNKDIRVLIPGAGDVHDARAFAEMGFTDITLCDISETAIARMKEAFEGDDRVKCVCEDFFKLEGPFDLIIEQTFFCALDPGLRENYVAKMFDLLSSGGTLAGVLFNRKFEEKGPPWGGDINEYMRLFGSILQIHIMDICYNSVVQRQGNEVFFVVKKPSGQGNI